MDDAGNEATNRPADSVNWQHGRVKTLMPRSLNSVNWQHGRVKTYLPFFKKIRSGKVDGEHGRVNMSFFSALNTPYYSYLVESSTQLRPSPRKEISLALTTQVAA